MALNCLGTGGRPLASLPPHAAAGRRAPPTAAALPWRQVAPKRQHLVRRLSKAASHAAELVALTTARCDARTQVRAGPGDLPPVCSRRRRSLRQRSSRDLQCCWQESSRHVLSPFHPPL